MSGVSDAAGTGVFKTPEIQMEDWYQRFINVVVPLKRRGFGIAVNPADKQFFLDQLDRVYEDERWRFDTPLTLVLHRSVTPATFQPAEDADKNLRLLTMTEALKSGTGFGRWAGVSAPQRGEITDPFKQKGP